jgi:hypothetical protein
MLADERRHEERSELRQQRIPRYLHNDENWRSWKSDASSITHRQLVIAEQLRHGRRRERRLLLLKITGLKSKP